MNNFSYKMNYEADFLGILKCQQLIVKISVLKDVAGFQISRLVRYVILLFLHKKTSLLWKIQENIVCSHQKYLTHVFMEKLENQHILLQKAPYSSKWLLNQTIPKKSQCMHKKFT